MVLVRKNTLLIAKPPESGLGGLLDDSKSPPSSRMPKQTRPSAWLSSLTCNLTALTSGGGSGGGVGGGDGGGGSLGGANAPSEKKAKKSTATAKTTAAASKKKAPKQDPDEVVFRFVEERNKPVNAQLVADFLQTSKIAKTQVVKSLDALVDAGRIQCRVFGKSKLFWPHQDNPEDELTPEELAEFRAKLQEDAKRLAETNKLLAAERDTLKRLQASPSTAAARLLLERLRDDNARRSRALAASNNADGMPSLSDEDKKVLFNEHKRCTSAWKMHKMAYLELVGTLMDLNVPLTGEDGGPPNDEFWEEAGVINDEMDAKRRVAMMTARNSSSSSATADLEGAIFTLKTACDVIKRVKYQQRR
ncbi:hypothetical protein PPROV_000682200 [Pycnococcus provasolii]|uniref:Homologous-pairing protein 2 winged helix domain-containing protein n=1 Tax=Pycnococcus provasolii TaxID=41880 RepID=A0A830HQL9_9CHLO|nr:hypothetical protein PPROV_000682200 [Pycnococcus provasolii]